jgi:serine/threonine protein kinase
VVNGLRFLKDELSIIHRGLLVQCNVDAAYTLCVSLNIDVKPTNILVNTNGQVKLCDFGVR